MIALDLSQQLADAGFAVVGPAATVEEGMALIGQPGCDVAVVDINLGAQTSERLAEMLVARGIPFATVSGYAADQVPRLFASAPLVTKPVHVPSLLGTLSRLLRA
ncbi:MAG: hypothetical protein HC834_05520 [Rhodospirillales bacterium]|nr:hypothetical protein [Rhodospirillales bacterium]